MRPILVALFVLAAAPAAAAEKPVRFLICQPGGPDLRPEQQAVVNSLYRYLEKKTGLAEGRIQGTYTNDRDTCIAEVKKGPAVLFPSLPIFLDFEKPHRLRPVAMLKIGGKVEDHFYLLASKKTKFGVGELAGKTITGTHLGSERFVRDVVVEGEAGKTVKLVPQRLGLRAIRNVIKGKADAVLLDGSQYRALAGTRYEKKLRVLHAAGPLPTPPVSILDGKAPAGFAKALAAALFAMRSDATGRDVLEMFDIEGFAAPAPKAYASLQARFAP